VTWGYGKGERVPRNSNAKSQIWRLSAPNNNNNNNNKDLPPLGQPPILSDPHNKNNIRAMKKNMAQKDELIAMLEKQNAILKAQVAVVSTTTSIRQQQKGIIKMLLLLRNTPRR